MPHFWEQAKFYGPLYDWEWKQFFRENTEISQLLVWMLWIIFFYYYFIFWGGSWVIMNVLLFHLPCFYSFLWGFTYAASSLLHRHIGPRFPVGGNSNKGRHAFLSGNLLSILDRRNTDNELMSWSSSLKVYVCYFPIQFSKYLSKNWTLEMEIKILITILTTISVLGMDTSGRCDDTGNQ